MTKIKLGDKSFDDSATVNEDKVRLGDAAPRFRPLRSGDKKTRDAATQNQDKVRLGDAAPMFRPICSGQQEPAMPPRRIRTRSVWARRGPR